LILLLTGVGVYIFGFYQGKNYEGYKITGVVDGDTLIAKDLRDNSEKRLRILGIDAPELIECFGAEAKDNLDIQEMIVGKVIGSDNFGRKIVKMDELAIAQLEKGLARVDDAVKEHIRSDLKPDENYLKILREIENKARVKKQGIWSDECVKIQVKRDPKCNIKGNYRDGQREYYLQNCKQYDTVIIQEQAGDKWLCSVEQAKILGYKLASSCVPAD